MYLSALNVIIVFIVINDIDDIYVLLLINVMHIHHTTTFIMLLILYSSISIILLYIYYIPISIFKMEKLQAYAASLACPVGAIRLKSPDPLMKKVLEIFPAEVKKSSLRFYY